jgi:hypothetical protein
MRPRPGAVQEVGGCKQGCNGNDAPRQHEATHPTTALGQELKPLGKEIIFISRHGGQGFLDLHHVVAADTNLDDPQGSVEPDIAAQLHRLRQLLQLVLDDRQQCAQPFLMSRIVSRQLLQLPLKKAHTINGLPIRGKIVVTAGQEITALTGFGAAQSKVEVLDGVEDRVAMVRPLACRLRGIESIPGYAANQQQDDNQCREYKNVGTDNNACRHRQGLFGTGRALDWYPFLRVTWAPSHMLCDLRVP